MLTVVGKTVENILESDERTFIVFNDKTFCSISSTNEYEYAEFDEQIINLNLNDKVLIGLMSHDERFKILEQDRKQKNNQSEQNQRKMYETLKAKFEPKE